MSTTTAPGAPSAVTGPEPFAPQRPWDRNYFLAMVALIWLGVLAGFGGDVLDHLHRHAANWPIIVHVHAFAMVCWLLLLTTQLFLIRARNTAAHRTLGVAGAMLAVFVVVLGLGTAVAMDRHYLGTKDADPSFLAIQLVDIVVFAPLVAAAILWRNRSSAHKRLILLATMQIADAGFARWLMLQFPTVLGPHYGPDYAVLYGPIALLILGMGVYDLSTRGRLHPAYILGALWALGAELTGVWLYVSPAWKPIALKLIGA